MVQRQASEKRRRASRATEKKNTIREEKGNERRLVAEKECNPEQIVRCDTGTRVCVRHAESACES